MGKKVFDKIQHSYYKNTQKTRNRRDFSQHDKGIHIKPTTNITLNSEKLKAFPLISGTTLGNQLSSCHST